MGDVVDEITDTLGTLGTYAPAVVVAGLGLALIFWGAPKLIRFFKRIAN